MRSQTLPSPNTFPNFQHLHAQHTASHSLPGFHRVSHLCTTTTTKHQYFAQPPQSPPLRTSVQPPPHHHLHLVTINPHSTHNHGCHISANPLTTVVKLSQMDPKHSTLGVHANPPSTTGTTPLTHLTRRPQSTRVVHHLTRTTT